MDYSHKKTMYLLQIADEVPWENVSGGFLEKQIILFTKGAMWVYYANTPKWITVHLQFWVWSYRTSFKKSLHSSKTNTSGWLPFKLF